MRNEATKYSIWVLNLREINLSMQEMQVNVSATTFEKKAKINFQNFVMNYCIC
jgi:hypothetical protein